MQAVQENHTHSLSYGTLVSSTEAVFFLKEDQPSGSAAQVAASLSRDQFEDWLSGRIPGLEEKDQNFKAAFTVFDGKRQLQAIVLFKITVDEDGLAPHGWHMPLKRLADTATEVSKLGLSKVRLSSHSNCPITWHQDNHWDASQAEINLIKTAVEGFEEINHDGLKSVQDSQQQSEIEIAQTRSLHNPYLEAHGDDEIESLKRALRNETHAYRNQLQQLQQEIERQRILNERLKNNDSDAEEDGLGELKVELQSFKQQVADLNQRLNQEQVKNERLQETIAELQSNQSEAKEVKLAEEIENLQEELDDARAMSADALLNTLEEQETLLVAYHPGAGHIHINPHSIPMYVENPMSFAAQKCFVSEDQYRAWLSHHEKPECKVCGVEVTPVDVPREFVVGESDRCSKHQNK